MKTNDEIRRDNLLIAISRTRTASALAERADVSSAYLSQIKNRTPESKTGKPKAMGDDVARKIERALGESEGWMDVEHILPKNHVPITEDNLVLISASENAALSTIDASKLTPQQRLKASISPMGVTAETFASVAKVGSDVASQWLTGMGPEIGLEHAVAIQNTYGVNLLWLLKGKGEPGVAVRYNDPYEPITDLKWRGVPVLGMAQLGDNGFWADIDYPVGHGEGFVDVPTKDKDAYALRCVGDSMRPRIKDREFVVIEPNHPIEPGDEVLVKAKDGRVMVKEFLYKRSGRVHLVSVNENHPPMAIAEDEIEKMHYVGWIAKPSAWRPD